MRFIVECALVVRGGAAAVGCGSRPLFWAADLEERGLPRREPRAPGNAAASLLLEPVRAAFLGAMPPPLTRAPSADRSPDQRHRLRHCSFRSMASLPLLFFVGFRWSIASSLV